MIQLVHELVTFSQEILDQKLLLIVHSILTHHGHLDARNLSLSSFELRSVVSPLVLQLLDDRQLRVDIKLAVFTVRVCHGPLLLEVFEALHSADAFRIVEFYLTFKLLIFQYHLV